LFHYKIKGVEQTRSDNDELFFHTNSILKFLSDLFSLAKVKNSTNIFYSNDFNVLVDIIIRKLTNLTAEDQIRVDYLSLIQLLIKNSNYMAGTYRKFDLLECFNQILNEKDQHTIDQDIVRVILTENPELLY
jgi:sulfur transfer complex TusBCD TusB component (DsrH family)